ncbi:MAG: hypothetical protein GY829_01630 [Gammaproteobacteria bacterium]|nr:hypothetical protein [Gammaproteobacteria bacterium]
MNKDTLNFIGLDTHKISTEVAYITDDRISSCQHYGKIRENQNLWDRIVIPSVDSQHLDYYCTRDFGALIH